jgi:hypothetical protein
LTFKTTSYSLPALTRISHKQARKWLKVFAAVPFERFPKGKALPTPENALWHFLVESEIMLKLNLSKHYRDCTAQLVRNAGLIVTGGLVIPLGQVEAWEPKHILQYAKEIKRSQK